MRFHLGSNRPSEAKMAIKIDVVPFSSERKVNPHLERAALFVEKLNGGRLNNDPGVIYLQPKQLKQRGIFYLDTNNVGFRRDATDTMVHELIHSEIDTSLSYRLEKWARYLLEGRAVFGVQIFNQTFNKVFDKTSNKINSSIEYVFASGVVILANAVAAIHFAGDCIGGASHQAILFQGISLALLFSAEIFIALKYYFPHVVKYHLFALSLRSLAEKVGDPIKAFQINTLRLPNTFKEFLKATFFPSKFYAEEIAKAKKEQCTNNSVPNPGP